jgi:acetyl-CoA carboxylase biotin carboxyl carrier protein
MAWAGDGTGAGGGGRPDGGATPEGAGEPPVSHVCSPCVGIFERRDGPDGPAVFPGQEVVAGEQVARVRLLDLDVPVRAGVRGTVVEVLRKDGDPVEHDEPLVVIAPA